MYSNVNREVIVVNNLLDRARTQSGLSDVRELILRKYCLSHYYQEIADSSNYQYDYIKKVVWQLW